MALKAERSNTLGELYRPGVEIAPKPSKLPPLEESDAFRPVVNGRDANLLEADRRFGAEVVSENAPYLDRVVARFWKRKNKKASA